MTQLSFSVIDIVPEEYAVAPNLTVQLRIEESTGVEIHALALRCQVRIEPHRRRYTDAEAAGMVDLFGGRERWASTLRSFLWMQCSTVVQGFSGSCDVDLPMLCTYDFDVASSKYLHALEEERDGHDASIPLEMLFSGTVFTKGSNGFGVQQIPWDRECRFDLPVRAWRRLVDMHFPNTGWIRLDRDTLYALSAYRSERGMTGLDDAVVELVRSAHIGIDEVTE
ncbi:DUF6084 family protein [Rhodococcus sp. H36-A4]|uniref:DUF6084 family protein n=1 Tax=Rhodococcus sp. H36-A4 TaxID=3004353 RepID=UPI0022B07174|nr:DUF6084 family protein [Rhodococcus sp. H36-A4]MCZ4077137.1 DUF6084 family protein [Rhodococcus sp. H36-A4]